MGNTPDVPTQVDPAATAKTQYNYNLKAGEATQAGSNVNQVTPFGNLTYQQTGTGPSGVPLWTATTSLNPDQQRLLDTLTKTKTDAATAGGNVLDSANYGGVNARDYIGGYTSGLTKEMLDKYVDYLDPYFTRDRDYMDTKLKNQGINPGVDGSNPAYKSAMDAVRQSQGGIVTNFLAQMQPQAWQQAMQMYGLPYDMATKLATFGSPTGPSFHNTPGANYQSPDYIGATTAAAAQNLKNEQQGYKQYGDMMSGLFGTGEAVLGMM